MKYLTYSNVMSAAEGIEPIATRLRAQRLAAELCALLALPLNYLQVFSHNVRIFSGVTCKPIQTKSTLFKFRLNI